jgi:hypothetical protein
MPLIDRLLLLLSYNSYKRNNKDTNHNFVIPCLLFYIVISKIRHLNLRSVIRTDENLHLNYIVIVMSLHIYIFLANLLPIKNIQKALIPRNVKDFLTPQLN